MFATGVIVNLAASDAWASHKALDHRERELSVKNRIITRIEWLRLCNTNLSVRAPQSCEVAPFIRFYFNKT